MLQLKQSQFLKGCYAGIGIAIGYLPAAITFGLLAKSTGLTGFEAIAMSIFVYAGASQYMALNLIALGTGAFEIIFTTFIVNIRHLLMSAAVSNKVEDLKNVPYAALGALIFPGILTVNENIWFGIFGGGIAIILSYLGAHLIIIVLSSIAVLTVFSMFI